MGFLIYSIAGILGGVLGGMGMGGGTVLIPLLTIFYGVGQHSAQAINLIAFIPMAVIALIIHLRNKMVVFKDVVLIVVPGIISCIIGCYLARNLSGDVLRRCFGGFLILLSVWQVITAFKNKKSQ